MSSKFDQLKCLLQGKVDILVLTKRKLNSSFLANQFLIEGYSKLFRYNRNRNGGGIFLYIRKDILRKEPKLHERIFVEVNLRKTEWLLPATYHSPSQADENSFGEVVKNIGKYSQMYNKFLVIGDFNAEEPEPCTLAQFLYDYNAVKTIHENKCYKSMYNSSCIDLVITNSPNIFQSMSTFCIGLDDFHKLVVTVLTTSFKKTALEEIN